MHVGWVVAVLFVTSIENNALNIATDGSVVEDHAEDERRV